MKVILKSQLKTHYAFGEYDGTGITVLSGSQINTLDKYPKMPNGIRQLRHDLNCVTKEGLVLNDIHFSTPSAAAIFVTGRSSNGYIAWRVEDKISLREYLRQNK